MEFLLKIKTSRVTKYVVGGLLLAIGVATGVITTEEGKQLLQYILGG